MINDGVRRRSRPERELNYKQTHTRTKYTLLSLSPLLHTCGRREGYYYIRRVLPGREKFLALYYLRHVSFPTFPREHNIFFGRHHFINHCPLGSQWPPPPQPVATGPLIFSFPPFFDGYIHTRRHCGRPWRLKHFLRVGGSKSTTPPPFCLRHELGIYLSDLMHSPPPSPPPFVFTMLIVLLFVLFMHTYIILNIRKYICAVCVCFGRVFGLIIPPSIFSVCGNAKSFRSRLF